MSGPVTEDDFIRPLLLVREIAAEDGLTLAPEVEDRIAREAVEVVTTLIHDEVMAILRAHLAKETMH